MLKFRWETEFKETEIGEIPRDWEVKKLGESVKFIKGVSYSSADINSNEEGDLFITLNNFLRGGGFKKDEFKYYTGDKAREEQKVKKGDLIIAMTDMTNEAKVVGAPAIVYIPDNYDYGIISLDCAKAIPLDNISNSYLCAYLTMSQEENSTFANGVNVLHLNLDLFVKHKLIPYPPLPEQSRIATVLSYFDDLIENKKRQNEILEKTAMAIFKNWFVDFEPFKDGEFVDSELGKIPNGWEVKAIGEVAKIESGGSAPQNEKYFVNGSFPFVRVKHLSKSCCVDSYDLINERAIQDYKLKIYNEGSVIIQKSGESLKEARINLLPFKACIVNHLAILDSISNENIYFIFCGLKEILNELIEAQSGTSLPYLRISDIQNKLILLPPPPILQKFHSLVEPLFQKIINNQKQIMVLRKIRDTLLPLLVFGKLRVEEI